MSEARRSKSGEFQDFLCGSLGPRDDFAIARTVEGMLISKFTCGLNGAHDGHKLTIRAEVVTIDHSGVLRVIAGQTD